MLLLDENLSHRLVAKLSDIYPGITQSRNEGLLGKQDPHVWQYAKVNNLTIVTKDADDMRNLQRRHGHPPKVIIITLGNCRIAELERLFRKKHTEVSAFLDDESQGMLTI